MKSTLVVSRWRRPLTGLGLIIFFAFTILSSGVAAPADSSEGLVLNYELGKTYTYDYETNSVIKLVGTSNEESRVQLKGQAFLSPTKKNDFVLTLGDFTLDATSPNEKTAAPIGALKGTSSRFTTDRGVIKDFYVNGEESAWVANYHRAIASIFNNYALPDSQHSQAFYLENDVSGSNCPTEYEITSDGTFTKRRDLNKCRNRDGGYSEQYGVPYTPIDDDEPTSDTSIRSSQECVQKFAQGFLKSAECNEVHKTTLMSSGKDAGGNAKVSAKIQFKSIGPGPAPASTPSKLSSILFDHAGTDMKRINDESAAGLIEGLSGKLCLSTGINGRLSGNTAPTFLTLKEKMRFVSKRVLEEIYEKLKSGKVCEAKDGHLKTLVELYVDAAAMAGSTDSIAFVANLVKSGAVSKNSEKKFRIFTSFANRPGEPALESMRTLISTGTDLNPTYLLTASGIAYQYCLSVKQACESSKAYIALVNEIAKQTKENCGASASGDEKKLKSAVIGLQALGNLDTLTAPATAAISSCLEKSDRLKIHALQAIRRDPCQENIRVTARQILSNQKNPSHLRASAYLAISQCYTKADSDSIRTFIRNEESIQVLSFIKSHRDNAGAVSRTEANLDAGLFEGVDLEKLGKDPRKFSSALSYSNDVETYSANMIYSDDSFLPKIVFANSSAKLYGEDFGLIEFGAHLGGLEQSIMERMFGPYGENPTTFQENTRRRRPRREGPAPTINQNEIEVFHSQVKLQERKTEPSDVYLRIFGTTIYANSLTLENYLSSAKDLADPFVAEILEKVLKGEEVDLTESYPLYGDELIIPTVSGLSLWIHNEGAAIVSLKYSQSFSEDWVTFKPKFRPGVSIANNMKMTIAGEIIEAGLKAETRLAASTDIALTGILTASDDHYGYDLRVAMPPSDVKLVEVSNELFWILQTRHADYDLKQKMKTLNPFVLDTGKICAKFLPMITGINACVQVQLPAFSGRTIPTFPLSGPALGTLELSPPAGAKELVLKFKVSKPDSAAKEKILSVEIDAPGSAQNIKSLIKSTVVYGSEGLEKFSIQLESPTKKAGFSGEKTVGIPGVHDCSFTVHVDGQDYKLFFKQRQNTDAGIKSSSYDVRYKLPHQPEITIWSLDLKATAEVGPVFHHSVDFKLNDVNSIVVKEFISLSASVDGEWGDEAGKKLTSTAKFSCHGKQVFSMNEKFTRGAPGVLLYESDTKFLWREEEKDVKVKGDIALAGPKDQRTGVSFKGAVTSTSSPKINSEFDFSGTWTASQKEYTINLKQKGPGSEGGVVKAVFKRSDVDGVLKIKYDGKAVYPPLDINYEKSYEIENTPEKSSLTFQYSSKNEKLSDITFIYNKPASTYTVNLMAVFEGKKFTFGSKNSFAGGHHIFEHNVGVQPGFTASVKTDLFESRDGEGLWKNRVTTLKSDAFPQSYVYELKYDIDGQNPSHMPKLFTSGKGTLSLSVLRDSVPMAALIVVNKNTAEDQHTFKISNIVENVYTTNLEVKCNPKAERVEIITSLQSPPKEGLERSLKLVITGKEAGDKPGERTFGFSFDLKTEGSADPQHAVVILNTNRWKSTPGAFNLDSDNKVQFFGKTSITNIKLKGTKEVNGKLSFGLDHTDPQGKNSKLEVSIETQDSVETKFIKVKHELVSTGAKTSGNFEFGVQKLNPQDNTGEVVTSYELNGQKEYEVKLSNFKVGNDKVVVLTVNGLGRILRFPVQNELRVEGNPGKARVKFLGGYNNAPVYFNLQIEKTAGAALKKYIIDGAFDPNYKQEKGAAFSGKVTLAYGYKSAGDFQIETTGLTETAGVDGKRVYSFNRIIKASPGLFKLEFSSKSEQPGKPPVVGLAKINVENPADKLLVAVNLEHQLLGKISGNGQTRLDFDLETTKDINNVVLLCQAKIPSSKFEALSIKIQRKVSPDGSSRVTSVSGKLDDKKIDLDTNIVLTGTKNTAEATLKLNDDAPKKLSLKYDVAGGAQSAEATYQWGSDEEVIKSKGSITTAPNNGFTAKFDFDIPTIQQQWDLEVNRVETDPKKSFSFLATSSKSKQKLMLQYAKEKQENTGLTWTAKMTVDVAAPYDKYNIDGSFKTVVDKNSYVQGQNIPGNSVTLAVDYTIGKDKRYRSLTLDCGNSLPEKRLNGKLCLSKTDCFDLKTLLKDQPLEKSFLLSVTGQNDLAASVSSSYKVSEDKQMRLTSFDYSFTDPTSKAKKELGIKSYKKLGAADDLELTKSDVSAAPSKVYTRGIEIALPERTYGAQVASGEWSTVDTVAGEVSLWFDKKNSPNQKLILGYSKTRASVQEEGQGKDIILTIRHHKLQRDLKVKTKYRYGITSKVFDLKTEIDIFKTPEAKVVFSAELTHDVPTETYALKYGVTSDGQGFSVMTTCEGIQMDFPEFAATCTGSRKARDAKDVNFKITLKTDEIQELLRIQEGDNTVFYYKAAFNSPPFADAADPKRFTASGVTTELQLPGMTDTRIINYRWSKSPLRFTITTNPSSSKEVTGFWIGATGVQGCGLGISRTDENGKKQELVNFVAAVRSKQLQIDFDWNKAHIASYLEYVLKRGREVEQLATKTCANLNTQLWQSEKAVRKSLKEASQDFEPLLQWYENQLNQIGKKYNLQPVSLPRPALEESDVPPKSRLVAAISGVNKCLSSCAASINGFLDFVSQQETLPTPEAVKARSLKVRKFAETVANKIREFVAATKELKEKYPFLKKNARKLREKLVNNLQKLYEQTRDDLSDLFPYPEVNHFLEHFNDYFEVALLEPEKISQANKTEMLGDLENAMNKILANSYSLNFAQGKISAKLPLLWKLDAFRRRQEPFKDFTDKESECIKELFEDPSSIMPPVNATAFLVGNTNYVTFDGTVGSFEKTCQFLLASDFVHKNLSVVLDLGERPSDEGVGSTLFVTDHKTTVGITRGNSNHKVIANGKVMNLGGEPSRVGAFVVYEEGSYVIIEGDMGITLGCTSKVNICAVQVSGFYHGKLQGLFGKYNNEPSDDWTLPNGQVTTNDGIFQKSWKLDQKCTGKSIGKSDHLSSLYKALGRTNLDYDTFFSRSASSPHRFLL